MLYPLFLHPTPLSLSLSLSFALALVIIFVRPSVLPIVHAFILTFVFLLILPFSSSCMSIVILPSYTFLSHSISLFLPPSFIPHFVLPLVFSFVFPLVLPVVRPSVPS